ncbi:cytochrome P450 [Artomyces pyxidatus]|uniref:Cytochrome P450 n=1 Tax=Artomyces pyxidatus TaxID=48021 RepID=A0ACB8SSH1_9AGAM|nr:cytochrome P450 [Artomyces pyxidatus]
MDPQLCPDGRGGSMSAILFLVGLGISTHGTLRRFEPKSSTTVFLLALVPILAFPAIRHHFMTTSTSLLICYSVHLSVVCLSILMYRLSPYHPLAKFPGPAVCRLTPLWNVWLARNGQQQTAYKALHDRYGPVVRVGPNRLSVADVDIVVPVLSESGLLTGRTPQTFSPKDLLALADKGYTARCRLWGRGMSTESLKEYEQLLLRRTAQLVRGLENQSDAIDLGAWLGDFTCGFTADGVSGRGLDGRDKGGFWPTNKNAMSFFALVSHLRCTAAPLRTISKALSKLCAVGSAGAIPQLSICSTDKFALQNLTDDMQVERTIVPASGIAAKSARSTTSAVPLAITLATFFHHVLLNPDYYRRLKADIDTALSSEHDILAVIKDPESLPFLTACMNETLRLQPPYPTGGTHQVVGNTPRIVAGQIVPPGTELYVPIYSLHRNPRYFSPLTDIFWPDRWLFSSRGDARLPTGDLLIHNPDAFIPFPNEPTNCAARNLARLEMRFVICLLFYGYDMRFDASAGIWEEDLMGCFAMTGKSVLPVVLRRREFTRASVEAILSR